jgi:GNAT superfamily N-acetyltransferase
MEPPPPNLKQLDRSYEVRAVSPVDLDEPSRVACIAIIAQGGAVDPDSAAKELSRASALAVAFQQNLVVGVGAIKRARPHYAAGISGKCGVAFPVGTLELGYVAVDKDHQGHGLSSRLAAELILQQPGRLFATTDNDRMKNTLQKAGFAKKGKEWKGRRGCLSYWEKT